MNSNKLYYPNQKQSNKPAISSLDEYNRLCKKADDDYEGFWGDLAKEELSWTKPYEQVLDDSNPPFYKWFVGGELNVAYQCIGRHQKTKADKTAIIFEADDGKVEKVSYFELSKNVDKFANLLKNRLNVKKGDRVVLYMPMILEAAYAMLACTKIGAIHSIVFGGFSAEALASRIDDGEAKVVITADGAYRKAKTYMLKPVVDDAIKMATTEVESTLVIKRNFEDISLFERDVIYNDIIENYADDECEYEAMQSEDPLFLLYTSGSTGKPKGVQHSTAGYILWAGLTSKWVFDLKDNDIFWCSADIGWITGHTYSIYGPLSLGSTMVMFEGVLTYPNSSRAWEMVQKHKISVFYTAPTAIRLLHSMGEHTPSNFDLSSLRILGTVGEPIDPPAWKWYYEEVGGSRCPIVDTWWQTETGGHMIAPLPYATPIKPSCATLPLPGIFANVLNEKAEEVEQGESGLLCITKPWPSMIRTIWNNDKRFVNSYYESVKKEGEYIYFSGDGAFKDENGYITITGRVDDVLNVSGHIIGTAEVEAAIKDEQSIAEVAVVGIPDEIKGESIFAYIVLQDKNEKELQKKVNKSLSLHIGNIAKVDNLAIIPALPKTRSGKIMRRLLRAIAKKEEVVQDISTLENPEIVKIIQDIVNA